MIQVEFYSIPRLRAGVESIGYPTDEPTSFGELLRWIATELPRFAADCLDENGQLRRHYLAIADNRQRLDEPSTMLSPDATVLILSADIGG